MQNQHKRRRTIISWLVCVILVLSMTGGIIPAFAEAADAINNPNGDFYAYVPTTPNAPVTPYAFETPKTGIVDLEFDVTPLADSVDGHIAFNTADYVMAFSSERKIDIILTPDGTFAANNDSKIAAVTEIPYVKDQTYHVSVKIDIENKKYSAEVDGVVLATDYAFRNKNPKTITNIGVMGVVAAAGSFKVTNFSEKLIGLVDNDKFGMNQKNNPSTQGGRKVYRVGPKQKFKKVQDVVALLQPGDKVLVDGDATYPAPIFIPAELAGTKEKPITIEGLTKNGKKPLLKTLNATNMIEIEANNYIIDNFEIEGNLAEVMAKYPGVTYSNIMNTSINKKSTELANQTVFRAVFHKADNLVVRNCVIHDARMGILSSDMGSGDITVEYCDIYHNGTRNGQHNLYLAADETLYPDSVARVQFNYIHDSNSGNGLKSRAGRNEVYYNWFENNYYQSLELIGPDPGFDISEDDEGEYYAFLIAEEIRQRSPEYGEFFRREDSEIIGNVIAHTRGDLVRIGGDGTSEVSLVDENWEYVLDENGKPVKLGPSYGQTYGRYRFVNNTFIDYGEDSTRAIRIEFGVESVEMYNNVFYKPIGEPMSIVAEYTDTDAINTAVWASGSRQVKGSNNWVQTNAIDVPDETEWLNTIKGENPGFINPDPDVKNFKIKSKSPLKGAGVSLSETVATWPDWTNTLYDFTPGKFRVETFKHEEYFGTPVELSNIDNSFPNPHMKVEFTPVNPKTMKALPRPKRIKMDIGAFAQ